MVKRRFFTYPEGAFPIPLDPPPPPAPGQDTFLPQAEQPTYRKRGLHAAEQQHFVIDPTALGVSYGGQDTYLPQADQPTYRRKTLVTTGLWLVAVNEDKSFEWFQPASQPTYRLVTENQGSFAFVDEVAAAPPDVSFEWMQPPSQPTYRIPDGNFFGSFSFGDEVAIVAPLGPQPGSLPLMGAGI